MEIEPVEIRRFRWDDVPILVEITNRAVEADGDDHITTEAELQDRFQMPYMNPEANCFVAVLDEGVVAGYCTAELDPRVGRGWGVGYVHPAYRRRGIGMRLLAAADARHLERGQTEVPPAMPLSSTRYCRDTNAGAMALFARHGYEAVRRSWFMRRALDAPVEVYPLPDGLRLRPFVPERDARAVYEAEQDIFRDNWGYLDIPYEVWTHLRLGEGIDPAQWLVAVAGEEIAGLCLARPWGTGRPNAAWIDTVGVRKAWRRRGLARALLSAMFAQMRTRGFDEVQLEVDTENTSHAVTLYEQAGMEVAKTYLIHQKTFRQGGDG
mgnify:FL=1